MNNLVERLRGVQCDREQLAPKHAHCICLLTSEAAACIEMLRELRWYDNAMHTLAETIARKESADAANAAAALAASIEQLRTHEATNDIDKLLSRSGASSALELWGRLRDVGGMPPLQPEHVREIVHALYWAKKEARGMATTHKRN